MTDKNDIEKLSEPFKELISNPGINYKILDLLPIPIEIFSPDGMAIFVNRAGKELTGDKDGRIVGAYNLKSDPVCLEILGKETIDKIFRGESVSITDFPAPMQDTIDRGIVDEDDKPWESATMDIFALPIWDDDVFVYTICFFTAKNIYKGRDDIIKAQEYMDNNWLDEFDQQKIAGVANLSSRHFQRIFKEAVNITPHEYYQDNKIKKLQEKLLDDTISIEQAFIDCGVDSHGSYFRLFKEKTGKSPSEYRKTFIRD